MVVLCGAIGSILYAHGMLASERLLCYIAIGLDLPACLLAIVCLTRSQTLIHGLAKLGWEVTAGVSVYFLLVGTALDRESAHRSGYSEGLSTGYSQGHLGGTSEGFSGGANAGYQDGYRDGFNAGAEQQLSQDRATIGGFGY